MKAFNSRDLILAALFAALMTVGAKIAIYVPFYPVPLTFQPFFCVMAGILLGSRLALTSMGVYTIMGLAGFPVFASGSGLVYLFSPTFGYLLGFIAAAWVVGKLSEKLGTASFMKILVAVMAAFPVIYGLGIPWNYLISRFYLHKTNLTLVSDYLYPYYAKDAVFFVIAAILAHRILPKISHVRSGQAIQAAITE